MRMIFGRWSQVKTRKRADAKGNRWTVGVGCKGWSAQIVARSRSSVLKEGEGEGMAEVEGMGARDRCIRVLLDRP
jgi:hypothetical protein